jgi:DNA-binding winged helix-turn-helix (wHTH) protein
MLANSPSSNGASRRFVYRDTPNPLNATTERNRSTASVGGMFLFAGFRLASSTRTLTKGRSPVHLGDRALDILIALIERAGQIVSNAELLAIVWPNTCIEETALRVHISALRRALGDGRSGARLIVSVRGRGYMFVAEVERIAGGRHAATLHVPFPQINTMERHRIVDEPAGQLSRKMLVTIIGAGDPCNAAASLAVAERFENDLRDTVPLVDLGSCASPRSVAVDLPLLLRLSAPGAPPLRDVMNQLQIGRLLIVLNDCEHAVEPASKEGVAQCNCELIVLDISTVEGPCIRSP